MRLLLLVIFIYIKKAFLKYEYQRNVMHECTLKNLNLCAAKIEMYFLLLWDQ